MSTAIDRLSVLHALPDDALVSRRILADALSVSPSTVNRRVRDGRLPPPLILGDRTPRWRVSAVRAAIRALEEVASKR